MPIKDFIKAFDHKNPNWNDLPFDFPKCDLEGLDNTEVGKFLSIVSFWEIAGKPNYRSAPVDPHNLPFRVPVIEKTIRQAQSTQGYKASASWQTASLLRDLIQLFLTILTNHQFRRKNQLEDAARSMVSTFEEGWARPSTKEFLDFIGFSNASLTEVRGDVERLYKDGYLQYSGMLKIATPSRDFPYPPVKSRQNPSQYGKLRDCLREYMGKEIKPEDVSYLLLIELINKVDYLFARTVEGLYRKIFEEEKKKI